MITVEFKDFNPHCSYTNTGPFAYIFKNGKHMQRVIELTEDEVIIEDVSDNSDGSSVESNIRTTDGQ